MTQSNFNRFGNLRLELESNFYNNWPKIEISINDQVLWSDFIIEQQSIILNFKKQQFNKIKISYLNKRNGPGIYDTLIDKDGNVLQDQYCIIKDAYIDKAKISFLFSINLLEYHLIDGKKLSNIQGWMPQQGYYQIEFPYDTYSWIIGLINKNKMSEKRQSSLSYFTSYLGNSNNTEIEEIIDKITNMIEKLP